MRKNRTQILLILLAIAVYISWNASQKNQTKVPEPPPVQLGGKKNLSKSEFRPELKNSIAITTVPIDQKQNKPPSIKINSQKDQKSKTPKGSIAFQVINGKWAVSQSDILLGTVEFPADDPNITEGYTASTKTNLWPNATIPFAIKQDVENAVAILQALEYLNENTNVQFVPYSGQKDALVFEPWEKHCASYVGRIGGPQPVFVGPDCGTQEILHELVHALGFVHEQSRADRDNFVKINWDNIESGFETQFDIYPDNYVHPYNTFAFPFSFNSIMLYRPGAFAKSAGLVTMESLTSDPIAPVQSGLSDVDILRINAVYNR